MKKSIYGLTMDQLTEWLLEQGPEKIPCSTNLGLAL